MFRSVKLHQQYYSETLFDSVCSIFRGNNEIVLTRQKMKLKVEKGVLIVWNVNVVSLVLVYNKPMAGDRHANLQ